MDEYDILTRLALALGIGFLIGIERGWHEREQEEGERTAGLRTFTLLSLSGGVWALLSTTLGPVPLAAAFLVVAATIAVFRWRETEREGRFGATTLVASLLAFALGAYAVLGDKTAAAAAGVATTLLLAGKNWLHGWLKAMTWPELRAALTLLAMSFIALPVLPDRNYGPYGALNPYNLWLMTIVIAGVSFMGYVAVKLVGERYGTLIAGITGGVVSSTATTLDMARRARAAPENWRPLLAGALAASAVMFVRVGVVVALFGSFLLPALIAPLAAALVVTVVAAVYIDPPWRWHEARGSEAGAAFQNPLDLRSVLLFAAMLAVVLVLTKVATASYGDRSVIVLAAIAGVPDVDAMTLSMTQLSSVATFDAQVAILVAVAANSLSKSVLALTVGGRRFGGAYIGASVGALIAGAITAFALSAMFAG